MVDGTTITANLGGQVRNQAGQVRARPRSVGSLDSLGELIEREPALPRRVAQPSDRRLALCVRSAYLDLAAAIVLGHTGMTAQGPQEYTPAR